MKDINIFNDKTLKDVDIVFENCETYKVPADGIYRFYIDDIHFSLDIHINGLTKWTKPGETHSYAYADRIGLILNEKGMKVQSDWKEMMNGDDCQLSERLKYRDITHFDFNFTDDTHFYLGVDWEDGDSEFENKYQHNDIKEKMAFIDINKDYDEKLEKEDNDSCYDFAMFENEEENIEMLDNIKLESSWDVPNYVEAALNFIKEKLDIVMWNSTQKEYLSPFGNTGNKFSNDVFEVEAYDWNEDHDQTYNFKWRDFEVSWYKYFGRGMSSNRFISPKECAIMLEEILESLSKIDEEEII